MYCQSNNWWRCRKILRPSQNIWTLTKILIYFLLVVCLLSCAWQKFHQFTKIVLTIHFKLEKESDFLTLYTSHNTYLSFWNFYLPDNYKANKCILMVVSQCWIDGRTSMAISSRRFQTYRVRHYIDIMYLVLADRTMQVRFGLKVVWESWVGGIWLREHSYMTSDFWLVGRSSSGVYRRSIFEIRPNILIGLQKLRLRPKDRSRSRLFIYLIF